MIETKLGKALVGVYDHKLCDYLWVSGSGPYSRDTPCLLTEDEEAPAPYDRGWIVCVVSDISDDISVEHWDDEDLHVLLFESNCEPGGYLHEHTINKNESK